MRRKVLDLFVLAVAVFWAWERWPDPFGVGVPAVLALYVVAPYLLYGFGALYYWLSVEQPDPDQFESRKEAEVWLLERGYGIVHECDKHIVGAKDTLVPGMGALVEVDMPPDDEDEGPPGFH